MSKKADSIAAVSVARQYADGNPEIALDIIRSLPEIETMNLGEFLHADDVLFLLDIIGGTYGDER